MSSSPDITRSFGALLLGALFASVLSGFVLLQTLHYFRLYPSDNAKVKLLVTVVCVLDTSHTAFVWSAVWHYVIGGFGNFDAIDQIAWSVALSIVFTAVLTFLVHCFFAWRIFKLSRGNYLLTIPIIILAVLRLTSASATTTEMIRLQSFASFREHVRWLFTLGLALSSTVDIIITVSLFILLEMSRTGAKRLNAVIDTLILYSFETGSLTCAATVTSMICWIAMPTNFIFLGLHFVIGKLYANSLLVTLHTRSKLRRDGAHFEADGPPTITLNTRRSGTETSQKTSEVQISVQRSVSFAVESRHFPEYDYGASYANYSEPNASRSSTHIHAI